MATSSLRSPFWRHIIVQQQRNTPKTSPKSADTWKWWRYIPKPQVIFFDFFLRWVFVVATVSCTIYVCKSSYFLRNVALACRKSFRPVFRFTQRQTTQHKHTNQNTIANVWPTSTVVAFGLLCERICSEKKIFHNLNSFIRCMCTDTHRLDKHWWTSNRRHGLSVSIAANIHKYTRIWHSHERTHMRSLSYG